MSPVSVTANGVTQSTAFKSVIHARKIGKDSHFSVLVNNTGDQVTWMDDLDRIEIEGDYHAVSVGKVRTLIIKNSICKEHAAIWAKCNEAYVSYVPFASELVKHEIHSGKHHYRTL